jgi:type II secretory pathway pseudopilin PulG
MILGKFKSTPNGHRNEQGYMLLYLLFLVAILSISLVTIVPKLKFVLQREREQEMVHRGEQYRRAVRRYYRKMGAYPPTLDVLESTNNLRFLRKRYKDPINKNQDFKVVTQMELMKAMATSLSNNTGVAGAQTLGQPIGSDNPTGDPGPASAPVAAAPAASTPAPDPSANASDPSSQTGIANSDPNNRSPLPFTPVVPQSQGPTMGGGIGGLVGVVSASNDETIRIYNKKNHYKDWLFIYDPTSDRGGLLTGPYQPQLQTFSQGMNGQNGGVNGFNPAINNMNNGMNPPGMSMPGTTTGMGLQH